MSFRSRRRFAVPLDPATQPAAVFPPWTAAPAVGAISQHVVAPAASSERLAGSMSYLKLALAIAALTLLAAEFVLLLFVW